MPKLVLFFFALNSACENPNLHMRRRCYWWAQARSVDTTAPTYKKPAGNNVNNTADDDYKV